MISVRSTESVFHVWEQPGGVRATAKLYAGDDRTAMMLRNVELELTPYEPTTERDLALAGALYLEQMADSALGLAAELRKLLEGK